MIPIPKFYVIKWNGTASAIAAAVAAEIPGL